MRQKEEEITFPIKVLLVEDYQADVSMIDYHLNSPVRGAYQITNFARLAEAKEWLRDGHAVDIILLDLNLPDSRGLDTAISLLKDYGTYPIVVVSSLRDEEVALQAVKYGCQDYLVKSFFDSHDLVRSIRYAMERHRLQSQLLSLQKREIERLKGILPFCAYCGRIRDRASDRWYKPEEYLEMHAEVDATHGICPGCRMERVIEMIQQDKNLSVVTRQDVIRFLKGE